MKLITVKLTELLDLNIQGIVAQVTRRRYVNFESKEAWRTLKRCFTYKEKGKKWIQLEWEKAGSDACSFTGCTLSYQDMITIEFSPAEYERLQKQNRKGGQHD